MENVGPEKKVKKASDQVLARIYGNDQLPQRQGGLRGQQTQAQPLGWPVTGSARDVSDLEQGYHG